MKVCLEQERERDSNRIRKNKNSKFIAILEMKQNENNRFNPDTANVLSYDRLIWPADVLLVYRLIGAYSIPLVQCRTWSRSPNWQFVFHNIITHINIRSPFSCFCLIHTQTHSYSYVYIVQVRSHRRNDAHWTEDTHTLTVSPTDVSCSYLVR